jgi:predicted nucleic acid-binding protein
VAVRTAVDSSVLLDVVVDDARFATQSEAALRLAMKAGVLVVGECVLAEIRPAFRPGDIEQFLEDWAIEFTPSSQESGLLAGELFARYLSRRSRGASARVVPDFLIGAHAQTCADRLLTRDRGFYRDYFRDLVLVEP